MERPLLHRPMPLGESGRQRGEVERAGRKEMMARDGARVGDVGAGEEMSGPAESRK